MLNRILSASSLLLVLACANPSAVPSQPVEPFIPHLTLRPVALTLLPGATQVFQAEINYPENARYLRQPVVWRVVEPEGGTTSINGLYQAPTKPGVYHVEAIREDFPDVRFSATITVK
jgi:hypothetical protein